MQEVDHNLMDLLAVGPKRGEPLHGLNRSFAFSPPPGPQGLHGRPDELRKMDRLSLQNPVCRLHFRQEQRSETILSMRSECAGSPEGIVPLDRVLQSSFAQCSTYPLIAVRGVRSSWDTLATKSCRTRSRRFSRSRREKTTITLPAACPGTGPKSFDLKGLPRLPRGIDSSISFLSARVPG